jgi:hypothetical protein
MTLNTENAWMKWIDTRRVLGEGNDEKDNLYGDDPVGFIAHKDS